MKRFLLFLCLFTISCRQYLSAQCNVNDRYDKMVSGYHSTLAITTTDTLKVWGASMGANGTSDVLSPTPVISSSYAYTGTILKYAIGGNKSGTDVDQAIILTTTGLWAWGVEDMVLETSLTSSNAFQQITAISGANSYGLPTGVNPTDVAQLFATYQTLVIRTNAGAVWVLTQVTLALEANGGTAGSAGSNTWKQVKINSTTNLTNVTAVRGQVSSSTYNALYALTSDGNIYTWGNNVYLGDGNASSAKNYATLMTKPAALVNEVPAMIGVTGGIAGTSTTKNTYYLLRNNGDLYSLGDNTQKQCGDFTTTERRSWVQVKKDASTNMTNVSTFSVQEHNSSYPGVAAILTNGDLYTWGNNSVGMFGRTADGTSTGSTAGNYDPGMPVLFNASTENAIFAEVGGHTLVYIREGTSQFCYVGHQTDGSMGDGSSTAQSPSSTTLVHNCSSTPVINICGYVPVSASVVNSSIGTSHYVIIANGVSTANITVQLKDGNGVNLTASGGVVVITTSYGSIGTVTDNNNGTYSAVLTSATAYGSALITYTLNGSSGSNSVTVLFTSALPATWGDLKAYRKDQEVIIEWVIEQESEIASYEVERTTNGNTWNAVAEPLVALNRSTPTTYKIIDKNYTPNTTWYRVKQKASSGVSVYSTIKKVGEVSSNAKISLFPVPASDKFYVNGIAITEVKSIVLYNESGNRISHWNEPQKFYDISKLQKGLYFVKLETKAGVIEYLRLSKN
ncbi:MAG: T9SS type A sorting domain-containing protein [Chitinophagaceae bacterium]|nr:T9SS type A sorting domain-containing protein [Chitinophagaceae bacterium]